MMSLSCRSSPRRDGNAWWLPVWSTSGLQAVRRRPQWLRLQCHDVTVPAETLLWLPWQQLLRSDGLVQTGVEPSKLPGRKQEWWGCVLYSDVVHPAHKWTSGVTQCRPHSYVDFLHQCCIGTLDKPVIKLAWTFSSDIAVRVRSSSWINVGNLTNSYHFTTFYWSATERMTDSENLERHLASFKVKQHI